jgi:hypothetical protein
LIKLNIKNLKEDIVEKAKALQSENKKEAHEKAMEDLVRQYQEGQLKQYLPSILIGITQVPNDGITSPKSLDKVRQNFADYPLLHKGVDGKDNQNIFTFDLWDETIPGGFDRASILKHLSALKPIKEPRGVFGSVLLASDEQRLQVISDTLSQGIARSMESKGGEGVREFLEQAAKLDIVEHPYTRGIKDRLHQQVVESMHKQKETIKTLCMSRKFEEPKKLLANMEAMQKHLEDLPGCEKVGALYTLTEAHVALAEKYNKELETIELEIAEKEKTFSSLISEVDKRKEEISDLASSLSSLKDRRNSTELKMILGNNYLGEEAWGKLLAKSNVAFNVINRMMCWLKRTPTIHLPAVTDDLLSGVKSMQMPAVTDDLLSRIKSMQMPAVTDDLLSGVKAMQIPAVTDDLPSRVKAMQTKGEQPIIVLDLGKSIAEMERICTAKSITVLKADGDDEKLRAETCYQAGGTDCPRWLLLPGSDHGVLQGSRDKSYNDQVQYMESNYPDYAVGGVRELVTLAILKQIQDGTVLFPEEPYIYGKCQEQYQTGDWKGRRLALGRNSSSNSGGLVVKSGCDDFEQGVSGLFGFVVVF